MSINKLSQDVLGCISSFFRKITVSKVNELVDRCNSFPIEYVNFNANTVENQTGSINNTVTIDSHVFTILTQSFNIAAGGTQSFQVNNSHVESSSKVFCEINGYSGTFGVDGFPFVTISGADLGTFNVNIHNYHSANAASGNMYLSFFIINYTS